MDEVIFDTISDKREPVSGNLLRQLEGSAIASEIIRVARLLVADDYPIGASVKSKAAIDELRKGIAEKMIANTTFKGAADYLSRNLEGAAERFKDSLKYGRVIYWTGGYGSDFVGIGKAIRTLDAWIKSPVVNWEITRDDLPKEITPEVLTDVKAYKNFLESWVPVKALRDEAKQYVKKSAELRELKKQDEKQQFMKVISVGAMKKVHDTLQSVVETIHPSFVKSMSDWLMRYAKQFVDALEHKDWLHRLNEKRLKEHEAKIDEELERQLRFCNLKNNTNYSVQDVKDKKVPDELIGRYNLIRTHRSPFSPLKYNLRTFIAAMGIQVDRELMNMLEIKEEDYEAVSVEFKPGAERVANDFGEEQYKIVAENYLAKNVDKLALIIENKEKSGAGVTEVKTDKIRHEGPTFESVVHIDFQDGTGFMVDNKAVSKVSQNGVWFYQYPTTFHQVRFVDGSVKAMVPEAFMINTWSKQSKAVNIASELIKIARLL